MRDLKVRGLGLLRELEDAAGKCRQPVRLRGRLTECDPVTGEVIRTMDSAQEPSGCIEVPCGNRREQVCPPCSRLYKGRHLPGDDRRAARRARHPRHRCRSSGGVRDADRAVVRAGAPRAGPRRAAGAVQAQAGQAGVRARPASFVRQVAPGRGVGHRPAAVHGVLRLCRGGAVQRLRAGAVGPDRACPARRACPRARHQPRGAAPAPADLVRQGGRVPGPRPDPPARGVPPPPPHRAEAKRRRAAATACR
jgi:hypothetical protein